VAGVIETYLRSSVTDSNNAILSEFGQTKTVYKRKLCSRLRKSEQSFILVDSIYFVCTNNILIWICVVDNINEKVYN
jgi:hypothetical protein